jgi:hypothetical protein
VGESKHHECGKCRQETEIKHQQIDGISHITARNTEITHYYALDMLLLWFEETAGAG